MNEWRDVSTAPRDGTAFIAYWPHLKHPVVAWFNPNRRAWVASHNTQMKASMMKPPVLWMPIPEVPKP